MVTLKQASCRDRLGFRECYAYLTLVFATAVFVAGLTHFIALKKEYLCASLACINLGGQWCGVTELKRHIAFPFWFERCDVDDDAAACIRALA